MSPWHAVALCAHSRPAAKCTPCKDSGLGKQTAQLQKRATRSAPPAALTPMLSTCVRRVPRATLASVFEDGQPLPGPALPATEPGELHPASVAAQLQHQSAAIGSAYSTDSGVLTGSDSSNVHR